MSTHRRLRVFDQVRCIASDPNHSLWLDKGKRYFICEVTDPPPPIFGLLAMILSPVAPSPDSNPYREREYGIRVIGEKYPEGEFHKASDFELVNAHIDDPKEDRVRMLQTGFSEFT